jgi:hypothetical protein
VFIF